MPLQQQGTVNTREKRIKLNKNLTDSQGNFFFFTAALEKTMSFKAFSENLTTLLIQPLLLKRMDAPVAAPQVPWPSLTWYLQKDPFHNLPGASQFPNRPYLSTENCQDLLISFRDEGSPAIQPKPDSAQGQPAALSRAGTHKVWAHSPAPEECHPGNCIVRRERA